MSFTRHVGKHGDRKVAVIFREVPGEPHMCLVTYTELLNQNLHDPIINCIESDIGQSSEHLADALNRSYTRDGKPILQVLHQEGMLKKVQTDLVVMTPQPNTKIKLSELNNILNEMKQGEEAVRKLAEMDKSMGLQDPIDVAKRLRGDKNMPPVNTSASPDLLGDNQLANNLRQQAERMEREAKGLLAEADRLMREAAEMDPPPATKVTKAKKPATAATKTTRTPKAKVSA